MPSFPLAAQASSEPSPRDAALDWFVRRGNPAFSAAEELAFQTWLAADPAHRQAYAGWQQQALEVDAIPAEQRRRLQANLAYDTALQAASAGAAGRLAAPAAAMPSSARPARRKVLAVAAYAGLALGSGWLGWRQWQGQPRYAQHFETARGEQAEVTLPDGTLLQLDTQTRLDVIYYHRRRELRLAEGQLLLSVRKDAERPFQVLAGPLLVTVVGTRFSVRHTPGQAGADGVDVLVAEGRVRVEPSAAAAAAAATATATATAAVSASAPVYLGAGDQVSSDAQGMLQAVGRVSTEQVGAWHQYHLRFIDRRLDQVLQELARYREPQLTIRDPVVAALRVTGVFDPRDMASFQRLLPRSLPVYLADLGDGRREVRMRR